MLWLGFHGRPGVIEVHGAKSRPRSKNLAAAELATRLIPPDVNLSMVHFSSRSVLRGKKGLGVARAFSDMGVGVVSGYTKTVDWWESLLFDHLFLSRFLRLAEPGSPGSPRNFDPSTRATKQQAGRIGKSLAEDLLPMARRFGLRLLLCGGGDPIPVPIESTAGSPWPLRLHPRSGTQRRDHLRSVLGM